MVCLYEKMKIHTITCTAFLQYASCFFITLFIIFRTVANTRNKKYLHDNQFQNIHYYKRWYINEKIFLVNIKKI